MNEFNYFCSPVYKETALGFLEVMKAIAEEHVAERRLAGVDALYPVVMSDNFHMDTRAQDFCGYVAQRAWDTLKSQGYAVDNFTTHVNEMWLQEHYKGSSMEQHIHKGYQMVGFYFLDTSKKSSRAVFHDPRPAKVAMGLPEADLAIATHASDAVNFECQPGDLILTNSWLPHSFTRNGADEPFRFIHFNIGVNWVANQCTASAEVV